MLLSFLCVCVMQEWKRHSKRSLIYVYIKRWCNTKRAISSDNKSRVVSLDNCLLHYSDSIRTDVCPSFSSYLSLLTTTSLCTSCALLIRHILSEVHISSPTSLTYWLPCTQQVVVWVSQINCSNGKVSCWWEWFEYCFECSGQSSAFCITLLVYSALHGACECEARWLTHRIVRQTGC